MDHTARKVVKVYEYYFNILDRWYSIYIYVCVCKGKTHILLPCVHAQAFMPAHNYKSYVPAPVLIRASVCLCMHLGATYYMRAHMLLRLAT